VRWISISLPKPQIASPTVFAGALESLQMKKRKKKEVGAQQKKIECLERRNGCFKSFKLRARP
jgi:hypothetical protein